MVMWEMSHGTGNIPERSPPEPSEKLRPPTAYRKIFARFQKSKCNCDCERQQHLWPETMAVTSQMNQVLLTGVIR